MEKQLLEIEHEAERELILMLRNYRRGYPNTKFLEREIRVLIRKLKDPTVDY